MQGGGRNWAAEARNGWLTQKMGGGGREWALVVENGQPKERKEVRWQ